MYQPLSILNLRAGYGYNRFISRVSASYQRFILDISQSIMYLESEHLNSFSYRLSYFAFGKFQFEFLNDNLRFKVPNYIIISALYLLVTKMQFVVDFVSAA